MIIMGDLNGDLGNSFGDKGCYAPNDRGIRLLDFANYFNVVRYLLNFPKMLKKHGLGAILLLIPGNF